jgi:hypothetical protein
MTNDKIRPQCFPMFPPMFPLFRPSWNGGRFACLVQTACRRQYTLEAANSLRPGNWVALQSRWGNGALQMLTDATVPMTQRFYRVRQGLP